MTFKSTLFLLIAIILGDFVQIFSETVKIEVTDKQENANKTSPPGNLLTF